MKRLLLSIALIITTAATFAQSIPKMELKPNGFVSAADSTKNYVVLEVPKMKQAELYKKTLTYLNGLYKNPSQVISAVDGESITVNGYIEEISPNKNIYKYPFYYNIVLRFKDGKVRYEPKITSMREVASNISVAAPFYVASTDSPTPDDYKSIYNKNQNGSGYWLFKKELKLYLDIWATAYLAGINNGLNDNW